MRARSGGTRWLPVLTVVSVLSAIVGLVVHPGIAPTLASWTDVEHARGTVGTLNCATSTAAFTSRSSGRFLSGNVFAGDVDSAASNRLTALATGGTVAVTPAGGVTAGSGQRRDVQVSALAADSTLAVPAVVTLPAATPVPAAWVSAAGSGRAAASSGVLTTAGVPDSASVAAAPADWLTIHLDSVLSSATGSSLSALQPGITSSKLRVGGVSSSASIDTCPVLFSGSVAGRLARDYGLTRMSSVTGSPLVTSLATSAAAARTRLLDSVAGLSTNSAVIAAINRQVADSVSPDPMTRGPVNTVLSATLGGGDLAALDALLTAKVVGGTGLVTVDFAAGTVTVDIAKLHQLTGRDPNTRLEYGSAQSTAVSAALAEALNGWTSAVSAAFAAAVAAVRITSTTTADFETVVLFTPTTVRMTAQITSATLASLASGAVVATVTRKVIPETLLSGLLSGVVNLLVVGLASSTSGVGRIVAGVIKPVLDAASAPLATTAPAGSAALTSAVDSILKLQFAADGVLALSVNAQNAPQSGTNAVPAELAALGAGRFDVAPVRLAIRSKSSVIASQAGRFLMLARSSVGPNIVLR